MKRKKILSSGTQKSDRKATTKSFLFAVSLAAERQNKLNFFLSFFSVDFIQSDSDIFVEKFKGLGTPDEKHSDANVDAGESLAFLQATQQV
jgi:hypothetical protein